MTVPNLRGHNDNAANAAQGMGVSYDLVAALDGDGIVFPDEKLVEWGLQFSPPESLQGPATRAWLLARWLHEEGAHEDERSAFERVVIRLGMARALATALRPTRWERLTGWVRGLLA